MRNVDIELVQQKLKLPPLEKYEQICIALCHNSYINEAYVNEHEPRKKLLTETKRLAHLGDGIMNAAVTDYLFRKFPKADQGELTEVAKPLKMREGAVLYAKAIGLNNPEICRLGNGVTEENQKGAMFGEMFEALIGAIYWESDRNFSVPRDWFQTRCNKVIEQRLASFRAAESSPTAPAHRIN